jgi:Mannitol repressor
MAVEILSYRNQDQRDAHDEIEASSDRAAAIVSAAFLDDQLTVALKSRLHQDKRIIDDMFDQSGALGTFSAKINLAFLIGMFSKEAIQDLHIIRKVRNEFAHELATKNFKSQRVADLIKNMQLIKKTRIKVSGGGNALTMEFSPGFDKDDTPTPREVYIKSCQYFIFILDHFRSIFPPPPKPEI